MFVHVKDCTQTGHSNIVIRTGDTDVVVLAVAHYYSLPSQTKLYVEFGKGNAYRSVSTYALRKNNIKNRYLC